MHNARIKDCSKALTRDVASSHLVFDSILYPLPDSSQNPHQDIGWSLACEKKGSQKRLVLVSDLKTNIFQTKNKSFPKNKSIMSLLKSTFFLIF